ncbi:MAG: outer membrane biosynthesis protein TonB [Afipia broomeae]|jgi:outer membrane biosynthesis protein TonB|uniref:Energy transducer TonB n=2 Tax=Bacteria TaxID=2 RepID=A0A7C9RHA2_9BRAD|nr:energy transducer TonB [Candidatus Afipia apatlaquensis]
MMQRADHEGPEDFEKPDTFSALRGFAGHLTGFVGQSRTAAASIAVVLLLSVGMIFFLRGDDTPPPRRVQEFMIVNVVPPPPPPPPPPPEEKPPEEQKMVDQPEIKEPEIKEEAKVEEPADAPADVLPPGPLELNAPAEGPGDAFNMRSGTGNGAGGGGGGGSRWGYYAAIVQQQIEAALRTNPKTRNIGAQIRLSLWVDSTGRITRVQFSPSTGDPEADAVIRSNLLVGLVLRERPAADMPMPVQTRVTARRPG